MTTQQLLIVLLVVVVAVALVWLLVRRSGARKDEARSEAAGLRAEAEAVASTIPGQEAFAQQAEERAEVAQVEADRLAEEASGYRETVEVARTDYRAMLGRADEVDPDVASPALEEERRPMTRAEARQMREEAERAAWAGSPAAPVPGAAGAAVMGRDSGGVVRGPAVEQPEEAQQPAEVEREAEAEQPEVAQPVVEEAPVAEEAPAEETVPEERIAEEPGADESTPVDAPAQQPVQEPTDPGSEERSARIAAATDFRDGDDEPEEYVWPRSSVGTGADMDERPADDDDRSAASEAQSPPGEWGGPHEADDTETPVAEDVSDDAPGAADDAPAAEDTTPDEVTEGSQVAEDPGAAAFTEPEEPVAPSEEAYDPTPERDWSADEGELLAENADRADELAAEREEMDREAAAAGMEPVHPESAEPVEEPVESAEPAAEDEPVVGDERAQEPVAEDEPVANDEPGAEDEAASDDEPVASDEPGVADETTSDDEPAAEEAPARTPRRVSEFDEIRDGGYGMGSAAAIEDGAQPMDHPVQAYRDTMTYRVPGDPGYDEAEAHVWFYDAAAAERSGFRRSEG